MTHGHFAIHKSNLSPKSNFIENILNTPLNFSFLKNKKGALFSSAVLDKLIDKEAKYDIQTLQIKNNRSIRTLSSGEQKKALLQYLLQQKPDFLILETPFESLDNTSVLALKEQLIQLASEITFLQIFNRKEEILPIITHVLEITNDIVTDTIPLPSYNFKKTSFEFKRNIPKPITFYENIPEQLILLQDVNVNYDDKCILKDINWTIRKNEFWQLMGPNGTGKTTILSMIYGNNIKAYGQNLFLFGNKKGSGESVWEIKEKIGYFSPAVLELFKKVISVEQMLVSGFFDSIGLYTTPTTQQLQTAKEWRVLLNLENTSFQDLSTVQQRLVLIARAIIKHPPLLILDEPLTNLDEKGTALVVALINKIAKESETTILFVSHRSVENLKPNFKYQLIPTEYGSLGKVID